MNDALREALKPNHSAVKKALADAELELTKLRKREAELEQLIARGRETLGLGDERMPTVPVGRVTLHDAIVHVLSEHGGEGMSAREIADAVQDSGLYRKRDGSRLELNQIHARVHRYAHLFEKHGARIRLKQTPRI